MNKKEETVKIRDFSIISWIYYWGGESKLCSGSRINADSQNSLQGVNPLTPIIRLKKAHNLLILLIN